MMRTFMTPIAFLLAGSVLAGPAGAQTLEDALVAAYQGNPTLLAQRAAQRATDEAVPQALSGWRPSVSLAGEAGWERQERRPLSDQTLTPVIAQLSVSQPLYRGGRTVAQVKGAEALVQAGRERLDSVEQQVLLQVVTAYMDVVRDQAVLELNRNNEQVLRRQLDAANDRFRVGEITRTDVAQAEARVSGASADRVQAEGNLVSSRATYQRVVGEMPVRLRPPERLPPLPESEAAAIALAEAQNPDLRSAALAEEAARYDVEIALGALRPTLALVGDLTRSDEAALPDTVVESAAIAARLTVPLYQSGSEYSLIRQARQTAQQRRIEIDDVRRQVRQLVVRAYETLSTAEARIVSRREQARAASIALEGVEQEAQVGSRTTLDVLDAEQERLDAQVAVVAAERDYNVAAFTLLQAVGQLTAEALRLPVDIYDPTAHYNQVRDRWVGTGAE